MPIVVELLNQATYQDQQDLQKIYRDAPDWLFYASALCVTAVNRFVLSGLSAALPRVVV